MGTKRVGLARTQALIQNLKRELQMNGSRLIDVKGTEMCVYSGEISGDGSGGFGATTGITVPANSVITGLGVVVTTAFVCSSATLGVNFGTAADGHELNVVDPDSLSGTVTSLAVGKGTSTHSHEVTAMGGNAAIVFDPDVAFSTSARDIYGSITTSAGNITAGGVVFWVTYRTIV